MTDTNDRDYQQLFIVSALKGSATFLETLVPPAETPAYVHFDGANSRNFVLLRTLIEAQKSGFAMTRWYEFGKSTDLDRPLEELNGADRLLLESHVDEQSLWQRKLSEALVVLINFSLTNELQFYYHFLLLQDLFRQGTKVREQTRFFGQPSQTAEARLDSIRAESYTAENEIGDISRCWYMDVNGQNRRNKSFGRQLEIALASATPLERTALRYTYLKGFGEASGNIHLNFLRPEHARPYACFASGFASCGMLAMCVLNRAHQLSGVTPSGINRHFNNFRDSVGLDATRNAAAKGDFVLIEGPNLGIVEEVRSGPFGYEAYRVRKVEPSADGEIAWDWFTAFDLTRFQDRQGLLEGLQQVMAEYASQGAELDPPPLKAEMEEAIQQAMALVWRAGLGAYLTRTAKRDIVERGSKNTG